MTTNLTVTPTGGPCGAVLTGVDLRKELDEETVAAIRSAWLQHHVVIFPDQELTDDDFERFSQYIGVFGRDPFFNPIQGREHIAAIRREAEDTSAIFADFLHSDWSFQESPPIATLLYSLDIPPVGGDTLFANMHTALDTMPAEMRARFEGKIGIHSAVLGYSKDGLYGKEENRGSMDIKVSDEALERRSHPIIRPHPETGRMGIFGAPGAYIIGIEDMDEQEAGLMLMELREWQNREEFIYRHKWENHMLVMWDNRSVLHAASGGYEGHRRELHRITINAR